MDDQRVLDLKIHIWEDQARVEKAKAEVYERDAERSPQFHYALKLLGASLRGSQVLRIEGKSVPADAAWYMAGRLLELDGATHD